VFTATILRQREESSKGREAYISIAAPSFSMKLGEGIECRLALLVSSGNELKFFMNILREQSRWNISWRV
jgi:hypothetical protein